MPDDSGRIAVVEDDPIMGESLQRGSSWRAGARHGGKPARRPSTRMRACDPILVLCDIRLRT